MIVTPSGYWAPIFWIITSALSLLIAYVMRNRGQKGHNTGIQSGEFLMANPPLPAGKANVKAENLYWGFLEALKVYYRRTVEMHNGVINDYVVWFLLSVAILGIILVQT